MLSFSLGYIYPHHNLYIVYNVYNIYMNTTIAISGELKEKLRNLGRAGESYEDILQRMYEATKGQLLMKYLYDESDAVPIDKAIAEARKRWPKS